MTCLSNLVNANHQYEHQYCEVATHPPPKIGTEWSLIQGQDDSKWKLSKSLLEGMDQNDYQFENLVFRADFKSGVLSIRKDRIWKNSLDALFVFQVYGREGRLVHQIYLSHLHHCILRLASAEEYQEITDVMVYRYR